MINLLNTSSLAAFSCYLLGFAFGMWAGVATMRTLKGLHD